MTLDGTPEWNLLIHTLLFEDYELQADGDLEHQMPEGITELDLSELSAELRSIEQENRGKTNEEEETGARN